MIELKIKDIKICAMYFDGTGGTFCNSQVILEKKVKVAHNLEETMKT